MKRLLLEPEFEAWREAAREALRAGYRPEELDLQDATVPAALTLALEAEEQPTGAAVESPRVAREFLERAQVVAVHRDAGRWNLLYRVLWRMQNEANLLKVETDDDVAAMTRLEAQVRRDLHKMHAFVRFRKVLERDDPQERPVVVDEPVMITAEQRGDGGGHHLVLETATPFGPVKSEIEECGGVDAECEHFVAWYQPDHRILAMAAPFFAERFAIMRWSILTPDGSVSWDPAAKKMTWGPGVKREEAPAEDELEELWRSYYASIYNPARLNTDAMRSEMPVRYWKNMPELTVLPTLITQSRTRVTGMVERQKMQPSAAPYVPEEHTVAALREALPGCEGCELYRFATQAVGGQGRAGAALMLVGEQPGDKEDKEGKPFVGPAGAVLDEVLEELRIPRTELYVTNAVKHFKFVQRGKARLHQNPRMSEITACKPWLQAELEAVQPKVVLCLGASASKSLLGGTFALMRDHGKEMTTKYAERVFATIHPSAVLRARDEASRQQLRQMLTEDVARAWRAVTVDARAGAKLL